MKNKTFYYSAAAAGILLAIFLIVFGSMLPFMKSRMYIKVSNAMGSVQSVEELKQVLDPAFSFYSPVGSEELAKFTSNSLYGVVTNPDQNEQVALAVLGYIEPKMHQDNVRHILLLGRMYYTMWQIHRKPEYLKKAEEYFLAMYEIAPRLPQPIYGLFEVYRDMGDVTRMSQMGEKILELWPTEPRIRKVDA